MKYVCPEGSMSTRELVLLRRVIAMGEKYGCFDGTCLEGAFCDVVSQAESAAEAWLVALSVERGDLFLAADVDEEAWRYVV